MKSKISVKRSMTDFMVQLDTIMQLLLPVRLTLPIGLNLKNTMIKSLQSRQNLAQMLSKKSQRKKLLMLGDS
jgi:hypothetical protein